MDYVEWVERVFRAVDQAYQEANSGERSYGVQREAIAIALGVIGNPPYFGRSVVLTTGSVIDCLWYNYSILISIVRGT